MTMYDLGVRSPRKLTCEDALSGCLFAKRLEKGIADVLPACRMG